MAAFERRPFPVLSLAVLVLAGCGSGEEIRRYRVERVEAKPMVRPEGPPVRFLGAIATHGDRMWFFRLLGAKEAVDAVKEPFDAFLQTVRFSKEGEPTWKLPQDWKQLPGNMFRFATISIPQMESKALDVSVSSLDRGSNTVLANVNRWRGQIGLGDLGPGELKKAVPDIDIDGVVFSIVDMEGVQGGGGGPFAGGKKPPAFPEPKLPAGKEPGSPFAYEKPAGWKVPPRPFPLSVLSFVAEDGDAFAKVTVTPLPGKAGGWVANVNRWRGQVGLTSLSEMDLSRDPGTAELDVLGVKCKYVDCDNPKGAGDNRILGLIVEQPDRTLFVKMTGPSPLVGRNKAAFEAFVRSLRPGGAKE